MQNLKRCAWCEDGGIMQAYHDEEWGVPVHDDRKQFEFILLEVMQCGLNWLMMLKKRETFKQCFDAFDYEKIALYGEDKIQSIMETPNMIRSRRKIDAVIHNARCFLSIREEFGSFDRYLWGFTDNRTVLYVGHEKGNPPAKTGLSDQISKDLKKRGFKFLGSITVYAHLQACGIVNDHTETCHRYRELVDGCPVIRMESGAQA